MELFRYGEGQCLPLGVLKLVHDLDVGDHEDAQKGSQDEKGCHKYAGPRNNATGNG